ncbi:para-aminobenzoate synthetase [Kineococcus xinjiangensis]|uniref:aminodeoxychorismate synthase n=1 Tax=Kineococcus xinjiangensis TaxID=512762 RepID=A0A2S6IIW0_9ACTN|nr:aminodeoxychorismate synthase component I [Kineococcus xinjiangensis]PPK94131.1 para-aminobenzoate synthetase [Kineococcus xinjiangensis]
MSGQQRILLVDNHDSYTYNLFQLLAEVTGDEPVVVRNDDPAFDRRDLAGFAAVVVSPGPGHPGVARDFGVSAEVLRAAEVPVLGVCLGHQGIALGEGAPVVRAPAARHGFVDRIRHTGAGPFAGLPQDFEAVRYHSLCVPEPLPESLEAVAWASDGVVMGLRHRHRPLWGVQFHPESVASAHGRDLLRAFAELAGVPVRPAPARAPGRASGVQAPPVRVDPPVLEVLTRVLEREVDTEAAFLRLHAGAARAFWLDSASAAGGRGRFSFLGAPDGPLAEVLRHRVGEEPGAGFLRHLGGRLARRRLDPADLPAELPFGLVGGYVGYFGYELRAELGSPTSRRAGPPDALWMFADRLVVVDHAGGRTWAVALVERAAGAPARAAAQRWLADTCAVLEGLPEAVAPTPLELPDVDCEPWLRRERAGYLADVAAAREALLAGESYEVCLTDEAVVPAEGGPGDGLGVYRRLRRTNPAPYSAYLRCDEVEIACSSPERFLTVDASGVVESSPIKGTAPRSAHPEEDERLRAELATAPKTRAESLMIVDLVRNDLGRVCEVGSVTVPRLMTTESYATVHQLVSTVRGRLRPGATALDAVAASFPPGSMTGAPKERTMEIIDALEGRARGPYSGALGYLSCTGAADLNVVIRTLVRDGASWRVGAGGAIVLDSDPEEEFAEMLLKAAAPLRAVLGAERRE